MNNPATIRLIDVQRELAEPSVTHDPSSLYLIVLSGPFPGALIRLERGGVRIGRAEDNTVRFNEGSISRHHALLSVDKRDQPWLTDLGSTNGTHLNDAPSPQGTPILLRPGDRLRFGRELTVKLAELGPSEVEFHRSLYEHSIRDGLTGLHIRAYFLDQLPTLISHGPAVGKSPAVLMIDLDHFKRVNDTFGHSAGDAVLRMAAVVLLDSTRHDDLVGLFGGEEFVVALPVPAVKHAMLVAERIRQSFAACETTHNGQTLQVTASIGVAYAPPAAPRSALVLVEEADRQMYQAKAAGRNQVACQWSDDWGVAGSLTDAHPKAPARAAISPMTSTTTAVSTS